MPLAALIGKELKNEKMAKPNVRYGCAAQSKKGEDFYLMKTDCQRLPGKPSSTFSVFGVTCHFPSFSSSVTRNRCCSDVNCDVNGFSESVDCDGHVMKS